MKKIIRKLIIASAMFGTLFSMNNADAFTISSVESRMANQVLGGRVLMGDANGDGIVNSVDVDTIDKYDNKKTRNSVKINLINADVNKDGQVNIVDRNMIVIRNFCPGDVNRDKKIDIKDVIECVDNVRQNKYNFYCDINGDGLVNTTDVAKLKKMANLKDYDVNGDGKVTEEDASIVQDLYFSKKYDVRADVNNDGVVSLGDYAKIKLAVNDLSKMTANISAVESTYNNHVSIEGSCYYNHNPEKQIKINIYIGGDKGTTNVYHTDVTTRSTNNTKGWFGLSLSGAIPTGNQSINIYGYNEYSGKDEKIYSGKLYINGNFNHSPEGSISSFYSPADHQVYISGKVYDRDDMSRQVPVQVNIGPNASDSIRFYVPSNQTFTKTLSFPNVSGAQGFNIYAIDDYGPNRKDTVLKTGTIEVKPMPVPPPPNPQPVTRTALRKAKAYATSSLNSVYGNEWVDKGDVVSVLEETANAYKVRYPVSNGYKERWVSKNIFEEDSVGLCNPVPSGAKFNTKTNDNGWYGYHDINRNIGLNTPVYAITDGTAVFKQANTNGTLTSYGNWIEFTSSDGVYKAKYCHLNGFNGVSLRIPSSKTLQKSGGSSIVLATKNVRKGEVLGYIGKTGNASGVHLHFEIRKNGSRVDPTSVFSGLI